MTRSISPRLPTRRNWLLVMAVVTAMGTSIAACGGSQPAVTPTPVIITATARALPPELKIVSVQPGSAVGQRLDSVIGTYARVPEDRQIWLLVEANNLCYPQDNPADRQRAGIWRHGPVNFPGSGEELLKVALVTPEAAVELRIASGVGRPGIRCDLPGVELIDAVTVVVGVTPTATATSTPAATWTPTSTLTPTPCRQGFVSNSASVEPGIFAPADRADMAHRAPSFTLYYTCPATLDGQVVAPGFDDNVGYRLIYDRISQAEFACFAINLPETDLSRLSRLAFNIKGQRGGEAPHVWLTSPGTPNAVRNYVDVQKYATDQRVSTSWQRIEIPLRDFHPMADGQPVVDLTHITQVSVCFEWGDMSGTVFVDGFGFE